MLARKIWKLFRFLQRFGADYVLFCIRMVCRMVAPAPGNLVALAPEKKASSGGSGSELCIFVILAVISFYWVCLTDIFANSQNNSDQLSKFPNWIQLLVNRFSFTIILINLIICSIRAIYKKLKKFDTIVS